MVIPHRYVESGVSETNMPAVELSVFSCPSGIKKDGMKLLNMPIARTYPRYRRGIRRKARAAMGIKNRNAIPIRRAPTCIPENVTRPFLIRINEVPQIKARRISVDQLPQVGLPAA